MKPLPRIQRMHWRHAVAAFPLAAALNCQGEQSRAVATYFSIPGVPSESIQFTVDDGRDRRTFAGTQLIRDGSRTMTPESGTRTSGTLRVTYELRSGGTLASSGEVSMPLRTDWVWGTTVQIDSANPARMCFGCSGSKSFPLAVQFRRVSSDSVWVTWGGNSIKNPVVY